MNTDPNAIRVLCYGDSNTWGQKPDKSGRYPANIRWTGVLQDKLGSKFAIIEEGLSSRTTDLEFHRPGRNGKTYLTPAIISQNPIDIVVLMLGTNDLKTMYERSPEAIAKALQGLIDDINEYGLDKNSNVPKIILVSPILIDSTAEFFNEYYQNIYDEVSEAKSKKLSKFIDEIAEASQSVFVDASKVSKAGSDGIHFDVDSQKALAEVLSEAIYKSSKLIH